MQPLPASLATFLSMTMGCLLLANQAIAAGEPLSAFSFDARSDKLSLVVKDQPLVQVLQALAQRMGFELNGSIPARTVSLSASGPSPDVLRKLVAPGGVVVTHRDGDDGARVISNVWVLDVGEQGDHLPDGALAEMEKGGREWRGVRKHLGREERITTHVGKKKLSPESVPAAVPVATPVGEKQ